MNIKVEIEEQLTAMSRSCWPPKVRSSGVSPFESCALRSAPANTIIIIVIIIC